MGPELYKELWELRFKKVLEGEKEAVIFYKALLKNHEMLLQGTSAQKILKQILAEEGRHVRLAHELLQIVKEKKISKKKTKPE